jgi:hypothetical protein
MLLTCGYLRHQLLRNEDRPAISSTHTVSFRRELYENVLVMAV